MMEIRYHKGAGTKMHECLDGKKDQKAIKKTEKCNRNINVLVVRNIGS